MENKTYFFGWGNIKKFITEIIKIYTNKPSFFSKKRIESGVAFIIAQWGMVYYFINTHQKLSMGDVLLWAAAEFAISGYMLNQIQKEKKILSETEQKSEEPTSI